jgi:hypothetical protein
MTTVTDTPVLSYTDTVAHFANLIMRASVRDIELASRWYFEAEAVAREVASNLNCSMEIAASVVSSFSPRQSWALNVRNAIAFSKGETVKCLTNNLNMANASLANGFDALKGQKTNAFARAIAGDDNAVVVDVWMMRAAMMPTDSPNKTQYAFVSDAVCDAANMFGITPRTAQALIWIIVRGSHD